MSLAISAHGLRNNSKIWHLGLLFFLVKERERERTRERERESGRRGGRAAMGPRKRVKRE